MTRAPAGDGDTLIIDTNKVHDTGRQIASDATNQLYNDPGSAFDLDNQFDKVKSQLPQVVQAAIETFQTNYHTAYADLLERRGAIGDLLSDTGTQAEINEFQTTQQFDPTLEPTTHNFYTK